MPDPPPPKRAYRSAHGKPDARHHNDAAAGGGPYAELHCRTNFSFLQGASHPDELVRRAAELGYRAISVTDRNSLAGVVRAHVAAKDLELKLLIGAEITPVDAPPVVLLATDRAAYGRLSKLITRGRRRAEKGECLLTFDDVAEHADGLLAGVLSAECGVRSAECGVRSAENGTIRNPQSAIRNYHDVFADRCYAICELHRGPNDRLLLEQIRRTAQQAGVPLVAANDVYYHEPRRRFLQDVLCAIREGCPVSQLGERMFPNAERYLKPPRQMVELFADFPEAVQRTVEVAERCHFSLDELRYEYPEELCPHGQTAIGHLTRLTWNGAWQRYPRGVPEKVRRLIEHELQLIEQLHYEAYFLTVWDLVRFARGRGILCQGRGSAANSAVCYCLGITSVDPERIDVLFERFVSKERDEAPDIDVDFEHERREDVLQYIYEKYGRDRAGMTAEVITYRPRSAVRDVGKALGLSLEGVDALAKALENYHEDEKLASRFREAGLNPTSPVGRQLIWLVRQILGFPRHLSQHVGGMVMTQRLLCELVPIENAAMPGRTVIQWDKDDLDALGILKVDCLALGMLTAIRKCFDLMERQGRLRSAECGVRSAECGVRSDSFSREPSASASTESSNALPVGARLNGAIDNRQSTIGNSNSALRTPHSAFSLVDIPPEDPAVYEMIQRADTMGVFQIESRAQMSMLPRLRPACFYDLVIEVAIVRPGPIQGDMVHPYLRRRSGEQAVEYPDERIRAVLEKTLGVPIFQEQAMRLAVVAAGFTPGEADQLRRAMGAWRRPGVIDRFRQKLIDGMLANGYPAEFAEGVYRQIRGFGEYGFPESHAASFALLVYVSAWLKRYDPAAFTAALLNSQPMGFYAPAQLIADARKHGVEVRPVDVNFSCWDCTLEEVRSAECGVRSAERREGEAPAEPHHSALRLGLGMISGLSRSHVEVIVASRSEGPFASLEEFARRTGLTGAVLERLSKADALASTGLNRRAALWQSLPVQKSLPLFDSIDADEPPVELPPMSPLDEVVADYQSAGLSLRGHPLKFLRPQLKQLRAVRACELAVLPAGRRLKVAGLVLLRQRPSTASGITFVTLEDETGFANLIVRPEIWERYHHVARTARAMLAHGYLQRQDEVIHVLVDRLDDLSSQLAELRTRSRDFR